MGLKLQLEVKGLNAYVAALRQFPAEMGRRGAGAVKLALDVWRKATADYPSHTAGNNPRSYVSGQQNTWYVRGFGSRWARKDGSVGSRASSQQLGRSWSTRVVSASPPVISGEMRTRASYAHWVQGEDQTAVHRGHGWKTVEQTGDEAKPKMIAIFERMIERALDWLTGQVG